MTCLFVQETRNCSYFCSGKKKKKFKAIFSKNVHTFTAFQMSLLAKELIDKKNPKPAPHSKCKYVSCFALYI